MTLATAPLTVPHAYPLQCGLAYLTPYSARRASCGNVTIRCRVTGATGTYSTHGCYLSGDLRLAAWAVRPLLTTLPLVS